MIYSVYECVAQTFLLRFVVFCVVCVILFRLGCSCVWVGIGVVSKFLHVHVIMYTYMYSMFMHT